MNQVDCDASGEFRVLYTCGRREQGSGKTLLAELAILRLIEKNGVQSREWKDKVCVKRVNI